jgi:hypothetical protein
MNKFLLIILAAAVLVGGAYYYYFEILNGNKNLGLNEDIVIEIPQPNDLVTSPFKVSGLARGIWFFEASAPIRILDANERELGVSYIEAQGDWMTTDHVPFAGTITFREPATERGFMVFEKDNPSGLAEYSASISIPVRFR